MTNVSVQINSKVKVLICKDELIFLDMETDRVKLIIPRNLVKRLNALQDVLNTKD